jgi:acetoin utilization deacetylase AcuC-like enzyme
MARTAVIWDERYTRHDMGRYHVESPERLWSIKEVLDGDGVGHEVERLEPREASRDELAYIHDAGYIERIAATDGKEQVFLDSDTSTCPDSWKAALLAAGGAMETADRVCSRDAKNAFAFVRPPGHHAERDRSMGFCFFNNIAIAAEHILRRGAAERIAIIDIDVHHGNGTQRAFYDRGDVFFSSIHRGNFYPGSGYAEEAGTDEGKGATLNLPLDSGADDEDYKRAFDSSIVPAVHKFDPELIMVSVGFDAHMRDPLGGMKVSTEGFRWMARTLAYMAKDYCDGKLMMILEGGYDLTALRDGSEVMLEELVAC